MSDQTRFVQTAKTTLSGSGCTSTATSIVLSSFKLPDNTTNVAITDFGDKGFATIEPGTSREEQISFTGVTQNANGTATLTGVTRGLRFVAPYDEVAGNKFSHGGGAVFVISNTAGFYDQMSGKDNDETVTGTWTFTTLPVSTQTPLADTDIPNKKYVDDNVNGGTVSHDQEIVAGNAGMNVAAGQLVYFDLTDKEWKLCDADTAATVEGVKLGIAQGTGTNGNPISGGVLVSGLDKNQIGMTTGVLMYAGNTAGAIVSSAGTTSKIVGIAKSATELYFDPNFSYIPTPIASETAKGVVEEATDAQVTAGTATGETGAKLFITPAKLATRLAAAYQPIIVYSSGTFTRALNGADATVTYAHGLAKVPKKVRFTWIAAANSKLSTGSGVYDASGQRCVYSLFADETHSDSGTEGYAIKIRSNSNTTNHYQKGTVSVDATNISIVWENSNGDAGTGNVLWEAEA